MSPVQGIIDLQHQMRDEIGKPKRDFESPIIDLDLKAEVNEKVTASISDIIRSKYDQDDRKEAMDELRESVVAEYESIEDLNLQEVRDAISDNLKRQTRQMIATEGVRPDGRGYSDIRELSAQIDLFAPCPWVWLVQTWTKHR